MLISTTFVHGDEGSIVHMFIELGLKAVTPDIAGKFPLWGETWVKGASVSLGRAVCHSGRNKFEKIRRTFRLIGTFWLCFYKWELSCGIRGT